MAYVPPHKRKGNHARSLKAEMLVPMSQKSLNFGAPEPKPGLDRCWKQSYAGNSIHRWFAVGLNGEEADFPNLVLRQVPLELTERMTGVKPLALLNVGLHNNGQVNQDNAGKPWKYITEKILQDLIHSSEFMRNETEGEGLNSKGIRPRLVARVGKVFFVPRRSSTREEDPSKDLVDESLLRQMTRNFYTNVPASTMEVIVNEVVPKFGVEFQYLKDVYHVKLSDKFQPEAWVMCKCRLVQDRLELYKIEMNQIRHMVYDVSCIEKNLDLRIMLSSQRTLTSLHDDEVESIRDLIASAVLDTCCKGGLRWPFGKATSSEGRYQLSGVGHTISRVYESPSLRLKVLDADRFDFKTSFGETTNEITLKLKGVLSALLGKQLGINSVSDMLEDTLKLLWEHFLPSVPLVM